MDWRDALKRAWQDPKLGFQAAMSLLRGHYYRLKFKLLGRRVIIGRRFRVRGKLDVRGPGTVIFGDDCGVIKSRYHPSTVYTHTPEAVIKFGNNSRISGARFGCYARIEVGENSGISHAQVMDTDFHAVESFDGKRCNTRGATKPIVIGRNTWIGNAAIILKGVRVGDNSVVGAGAVVIGRVPTNTVVFGNPARVVWRMRPPPPVADPAGVAKASAPQTAEPPEASRELTPR